MNCLIILLLLCCRGNSNGVCGNNDYDNDYSCGCGNDYNDNSYSRNDRCEDNCSENRCDRCNDERRDNCREDRREDRCDDRRSDDRRRQDYDYRDNQGNRTAPWQDYSNYNRNDSYNRNETCGCEEN